MSAFCGQIRGAGCVVGARSIQHNEHVHELKQAGCRLASSPYGPVRGCVSVSDSKGTPTPLLKATHIERDVPRLAASRAGHKKGGKELGKDPEDI